MNVSLVLHHTCKQLRSLLKSTIATHIYGTLSCFSCNAPPLDCRQALITAHSTAGGTVWTDKHCRSSSWPQLQCTWRISGLKVLLAKMLTAEVRVGCGNPMGTSALHLLLPFAKLLWLLGEFKQSHTIFGSFAASIGHTVVGHPVFCSQEDHQCLRVQSRIYSQCIPSFTELFCVLCRVKWWLNVKTCRQFATSTTEKTF